MHKIIPIPAFNDNYIWFITNEHSKSVLIVDPGDAEPAMQALKTLDLKPEAILITHHHYDHSGGIADILKHYDIPVYAPARETILDATNPLQEKDTISFPQTDIQFNILDIPGHTIGHIAYYNNSYLFCGDTLFAGGCGRVFEGTYEQMFDSLTKLTHLPNSIQIYCAHEYTEKNLAFANLVEPQNIDLRERISRTKTLRSKQIPTVPSTLSIEKKTNPFLRCHVDAVIKAAENKAEKKLKNPTEVFTALRQWKDRF